MKFHSPSPMVLIIAMILASLTPNHDAHALRWGVGPHAGMRFAPWPYPHVFPTEIENVGTISKNGPSGQVGLSGWYHTKPWGRQGASVNFDIGVQLIEWDLALGHDFVIGAGPLEVILGASMGWGFSTWKGEDNAVFQAQSIPIRIQAGVQLSKKFHSIQIAPYGQINIPNSVSYYDDNQAFIPAFSGFYYKVGLQAAVHFGQLERPPRRRRKKKKRKH